MKALVMYDSRQGDTEQVVEAVADSLRATMDVAVARVDKGDVIDLADVDLMVIGCPTHQTGMELDAFLGFIPEREIARKWVAVFDTRMEGRHWLVGSAASALTNRLRHAGGHPILSPETFYREGPHGDVEKGEVWRASNWARAMQQELQLLPV